MFFPICGVDRVQHCRCGNTCAQHIGRSILVTGRWQFLGVGQSVRVIVFDEQRNACVTGLGGQSDGKDGFAHEPRARSVSTPPTRVVLFCYMVVSSRTSAAALIMSVSSFAIGKTKLVVWQR